MPKKYDKLNLELRKHMESSFPGQSPPPVAGLNNNYSSSGPKPPRKKAASPSTKTTAGDITRRNQKADRKLSSRSQFEQAHKKLSEMRTASSSNRPGSSDKLTLPQPKT